MEYLPKEVKGIIEEYLADGFFDEGDEKIFLTEGMFNLFLEEYRLNDELILELTKKCIRYEKPIYIAKIICYLPESSDAEYISIWDDCLFNKVINEAFKVGCFGVVDHPMVIARNRFNEELESAVGYFIQYSNPTDGLLRCLYQHIQPFYSVNYLNMTGGYLAMAINDAGDEFLDWLLKTHSHHFDIKDRSDAERHSAGLCLLDSLICRKRFRDKQIGTLIKCLEELGALF